MCIIVMWCLIKNNYPVRQISNRRPIKFMQMTPEQLEFTGNINITAHSTSIINMYMYSDMTYETYQGTFSFLVCYVMCKMLRFYVFLLYRK